MVMQEMWDSVTPTLAGIPTTRMLYEAVIDYTKAHGLTVENHVFDVPDKMLLRSPLSEAIAFIEAALIRDVPVAFLNLCNGDEKKLSSWHWVTIIALDYAEDGAEAFITILDEGLIANINLAIWYNTTTMGGGFVYFTSTPVAAKG